MPVPVVVSDPGGYQTQRAGTFNITFAVEADPEMTFTITATVDAGKPPVLNVPAVKYPPYGSVFGEAQYMEGVSAIDDEDGVITGKVIYDTPVNTNTAGAYRVTYSVTDSDGNTTEKSGMVLVSSWDPPINYGIFAHDFSKNLGQVTGTNAEMINSADAKAIDLRHILSDGSPNPNYGKPTPVVVWDTGGYQAQRAGIFKITFAVQDDLNTRFTITAIVGADDNQFTPNVNPDNESIDESTEEPIEESTDELIDESTTELTDEDTIDLAALPSRAFEIADKTWTGKQIKSDLKIAVSYQVNGASVTKTLNAGADYTITNYGVNRNIGNATVTIEGNAGSDYTGEKTLSFRIVPTKPTELKLEAGVKSIKVGFKKVSAEQDVKTYRIDYRVKGAKKWTSITASVKSTGNAGKKQTASVTLKKLKQKKTYEVRVYAYKGAYKSPPTSVKSIKTK
jgi:hypothetical protein